MVDVFVVMVDVFVVVVAEVGIVYFLKCYWMFVEVVEIDDMREDREVGTNRYTNRWNGWHPNTFVLLHRT